MTGHVRCGGSTLARRLGCPGSLYAETLAGAMERLPQSDSDAARAGTLLHELFERALKRGRAVADVLAEYHPEHELHTLDTACVAEAVDHIHDTVPFARRPEIMVEIPVDFRRWAPDPMGAYGRLDAAWVDESAKTLYVWDLKTGRVPVSAIENPQLRAYALGVLDGEAFLDDIHHVEMVVLQHAIDNVSVERIGKGELFVWGKQRLKKGIELALDPSERYFEPTESNCRYCTAKLRCRPRAAVAANLVRDAMGAAGNDLMGDDEIERRYPEVRAISQWSTNFVEEADKRIVAGALGVPAGYAVGEKQTRRRWRDGVDIAAVAEALGEPPEAITSDKLLGLGELEKKYGKDALEGLLEKPAGAKTVIPVRGAVDYTEGFTFGNDY